MKKLLLPLLFLPLLFNSCKKAEEKSTPLISGNVDYEFTIKINGYEHKIEGNTFDGDPFGNGGIYFWRASRSLI